MPGPQEAFGVNAYIRDATDRFAALGFTALAPELFQQTGPVSSYDPGAATQSWALTQEFLRVFGVA